VFPDGASQIMRWSDGTGIDKVVIAVRAGEWTRFLPALVRRRDGDAPPRIGMRAQTDSAQPWAPMLREVMPRMVRDDHGSRSRMGIAIVVEATLVFMHWSVPAARSPTGGRCWRMPARQLERRLGAGHRWACIICHGVALHLLATGRATLLDPRLRQRVA